MADDDRLNVAAALFGESASRIVVSTPADTAPAVLALAAQVNVPAREIGVTGGSVLRMDVGEQPAIDLSVATAERAWADALERSFKRQVA